MVITQIDRNNRNDFAQKYLLYSYCYTKLTCEFIRRDIQNYVAEG